MTELRESDLYAPVKAYLEHLGYEVKGEVKDCDLTAVRGEELIVVALKRGFTMELLYQAIDRQRLADSVYVAVPLPKRGYLAPRLADMKALCRRLELGLIFVGFTGAGVPQVDVYLHPAEAAVPRRNAKRRRAVLQEHAGRTGDANTGGVTHRKILTRYKEQALRVARLLRDHGPLTVAGLRKLDAPENTSAIVGRNVLRWFERAPNPEGRLPCYAVNETGLAALAEYADLLGEMDGAQPENQDLLN